MSAASQSHALAQKLAGRLERMGLTIRFATQDDNPATKILMVSGTVAGTRCRDVPIFVSVDVAGTWVLTSSQALLTELKLIHANRASLDRPGRRPVEFTVLEY